MLSALSLRPTVYGLGRDHMVDSQGKAGKEQESTLCIELSFRFSMYKIDSDSEHDPSWGGSAGGLYTWCLSRLARRLVLLVVEIFEVTRFSRRRDLREPSAFLMIT